MAYPNPDGDQDLNNQQLWHRDRDDFSSLKLFIYCSDVTMIWSTFIYPGSHDFNDSIFDITSMNQEIVDGTHHDFLSDAQILSLYHLPLLSAKVFTGDSASLFSKIQRLIEHTHLFLA